MDSDTSLQELEDELFIRPQVRETQAANRLSDPSSLIEKTAGTNGRISLQGAEWAPVAGSHRNGNGIPTIAVKLPVKKTSDDIPTLKATPILTTVKVTSIKSNVSSSSKIVSANLSSTGNIVINALPKPVTTKPNSAPSFSQVAPIIVFPNGLNSHLSSIPSQPPQFAVKGEKLEPGVSAALKPGQNTPMLAKAFEPTSPKVMKLTPSSEIVRNVTQELASKGINVTLQRYVGKPKDEPPVKQPKTVDYTICSACKKIVESHRLAIHVATEHGSNQKPKSPQTKDEQEEYEQVEAMIASGAIEISDNCPLCNRKVSKDRFYSHLQLIHGQSKDQTPTEEIARKPFQCLKCQARFALRRILTRHQQFCDSNDPSAKSHMCETCGACFFDLRFLQAHITRAHTTHFNCDECSASFRLKRFLIQHKMAKHRKRRPKGAKVNSEAAENVQNHQDESMTDTLTVKGEGVSDDEDLGEEELEEEEDVAEEVLAAEAISESPAHDMVDSIPQSPLKSPPVNNIPVAVENATEDHSTETPTKTPKRRGRVRVDDGRGPPYICKHCGKVCKHAAELGDHVDMHEGIKRHKCDLCEKAYTFKSALFVHKKSHEREDSGPQYACDICFEMFKQKPALNRHKLQKHPEDTIIDPADEQLTCNHCFKTFKNEQALRMHSIKKHAGPGQGQRFGDAVARPDGDDDEISEAADSDVEAEDDHLSNDLSNSGLSEDGTLCIDETPMLSSAPSENELCIGNQV